MQYVSCYIMLHGIKIYSNTISKTTMTVDQHTWTAARTAPLFRVEADVTGTRIVGVRYALRDERKSERVKRTIDSICKSVSKSPS